MLSEHGFDSLTTLAVDLLSSFRPEFPFHPLFQPIRIRDPPPGRILLPEFFPAFPVFGRSDEQLHLLIFELCVCLALVPGVGKRLEKALAVDLFKRLR